MPFWQKMGITAPPRRRLLCEIMELRCCCPLISISRTKLPKTDVDGRIVLLDVKRTILRSTGMALFDSSISLLKLQLDLNTSLMVVQSLRLQYLMRKIVSLNKMMGAWYLLEHGFIGNAIIPTLLCYDSSKHRKDCCFLTQSLPSFPHFHEGLEVV
jgi:hypothetical protein